MSRPRARRTPTIQGSVWITANSVKSSSSEASEPKKKEKDVEELKDSKKQEETSTEEESVRVETEDPITSSPEDDGEAEEENVEEPVTETQTEEGYDSYAASEASGEHVASTPRSWTHRTRSKRKASYVDDDEEEEEEEEPEDEEEDMDFESETFAQPSTPIHRMTKRQRAKQGFLEEGEDELLELPLETSGRKKLTPEEMALRRIENARKRKNQSEQRLEEEKQETINRLLKRQATTGRNGRSRRRGTSTSSSSEQSEVKHKERTYMYQPFATISWRSTKDGESLGIPQPLVRFF
ncbi:Ino80 complex subunit Ies2 [Schizosaccharomyces japonicus yFS275]|uniref:Ino80 complex subunit Ies2 n=1 Tax=Schizosaccharomyces japonicus (strain yFS275 / FY16936) TaxID=402676 RepID=B6K8B2_SCHJY|nr:Ino80 complex subunit Ies2 [Schizosaccharomyces japonicus yFS275]EEB09766.1 Ino80 complex subunit Ies2 [Schizosaccharomyces japonicus yFS275]